MGVVRINQPLELRLNLDIIIKMNHHSEFFPNNRSENLIFKRRRFKIWLLMTWNF